MEKGNPFIEMANMIGEKKGSALTLVRGTVVAVNPLTIDGAGLKNLSGDALLVSADLTQVRKGTISGTGSGSAGSVTVSGTCELPAPLQKGDQVLMLTVDYQVFYVFCKVVGSK